MSQRETWRIKLKSKKEKGRRKKENKKKFGEGTQTHRQQGDPISLVLFSQHKKIML
jgi:hypothetical protein